MRGISRADAARMSQGCSLALEHLDVCHDTERRHPRCDIRVRPAGACGRWPRASSRPRWPDDAKPTKKTGNRVCPNRLSASSEWWLRSVGAGVEWRRAPQGWGRRAQRASLSDSRQLSERSAQREVSSGARPRPEERSAVDPQGRPPRSQPRRDAAAARTRGRRPKPWTRQPAAPIACSPHIGEEPFNSLRKLKGPAACATGPFPIALLSLQFGVISSRRRRRWRSGPGPCDWP